VPNVYVRTLQRAADIAGGEQKLALRLKVTPSHLALWIRGMEPMPVRVFFRAVDLVTEHELSLLTKTMRVSAAAAKLELEGIVAKRADAPYRRGRSSDWVKIKTPVGLAIDEMRAKWGESGT
jgi:hypothetical protein